MTSLLERLTPDVEVRRPPRREALFAVVLLYAAWCYANLAANGLYALSATRGPGYRDVGEVVYFAGVVITGVLATLHLARRWGLDVRVLPERRGPLLWLGWAGLFVFAVVIGIAAMTEQGMSLTAWQAQSWADLAAPVFVFVPTMIAYTLLWHVVLFQGLRRVFGAGEGSRSWLRTAGAVVATSAIYAVYHLASIDEIVTLSAMADEIAITFAIRCVLLLSVVALRSIGPALAADFVMNYFVFSPMPHFHPDPWKWPLGGVILVVLWTFYRYGWQASGREERG